MRGFLNGLGSLVLASAVLGAGPAQLSFAQSKASQAKLKKLLNSPGYVKKLQFILSRYEASVSGCKAPKVAGRISAKLLRKPVAMPGVGMPKTLQWIDIVRVEGCGKPFSRKVIATVHKGQAVFFPYLSGSTKTSPRMQFEAMRQVLARERTRSTKAGCKKNSPLTLSTTKFVAEAKVSTGTMWRESWTVQNCKGKRAVGILFAPDPKGKMTISIE